MKAELSGSYLHTPLSEINDISKSEMFSASLSKEVDHEIIMEWQKIMLNETLQLNTKVSGISKIATSVEQLMRGQ